LASVHEAARDMHAAGVMDIKTMRRFDELCLGEIDELSPKEIRAIREGTNTSQTLFGRHLNVTGITVSQWERGERRPGGPALKLLWLVKRRGLSAIRLGP
jgi:putative transcriptional regulator